MDPITVVAAASGIVKALGLDRVVGQWLGGDKGEEMAGRVLDVTRAVTGAGSTEEAIAVLAADQEANVALKAELLRLADAKAERDHHDRVNARALQVAALQQDDLFSKRFVYYFASAWSLFAMSYICLITVMQIPEGNQRFADTILGFLLGTIIATMVAYFFGSSSGSKASSSTLQAVLSKLTDKT